MYSNSADLKRSAFEELIIIHTNAYCRNFSKDNKWILLLTEYSYCFHAFLKKITQNNRVNC